MDLLYECTARVIRAAKMRIVPMIALKDRQGYYYGGGDVEPCRWYEAVE